MRWLILLPGIPGHVWRLISYYRYAPWEALRRSLRRQYVLWRWAVAMQRRGE